MRLKQTVTTTEGRDSKSQVVVFNRANHVKMIRLFFATKVWILNESFVVK
jgi:hypothetical protein